MPVGGDPKDDVAQLLETTEAKEVVEISFPFHEVPKDDVAPLFKDEEATPTAKIRAIDFEINRLG